MASCANPVELSQSETALVTSQHIDLSAAQSLKRILGTHIEAYRKSVAQTEKAALNQALARGQTDGERGELIAKSLFNPKNFPIVGIQAAIPRGTTDDTAISLTKQVQGELPAGYTATFANDDTHHSIVIQRTN